MGKSLGNFVTLDDLFAKFDPMVVRYFILQFHYRKPVDFSMDQIDKAREQYEKFSANFAKIKELANDEYSIVSDPQLVEIKNNFEQAMSDDFNTPLAIAEVLRFSKVAGQIISSNDKNLASQANNLVKMIEDLFGFEFKFDIMKEETKSNDEVLLNLISNIREKLRANKNFEMSDYIRDELSKLDITIKDKKI